jgi:hypothetical protein
MASTTLNLAHNHFNGCCRVRMLLQSGVTGICGRLQPPTAKEPGTQPQSAILYGDAAVFVSALRMP